MEGVLLSSPMRRVGSVLLKNDPGLLPKVSPFYRVHCVWKWLENVRPQKGLTAGHAQKGGDEDLVGCSVGRRRVLR